MRHTIYSFSFFSIFLIFSFACFSQTTRQKLLFNSDWKFFKGDVKNGEAIKYNDDAWRNVSLPHDWSIEGPFSQQWASATAYLPPEPVGIEKLLRFRKACKINIFLKSLIISLFTA